MSDKSKKKIKIPKSVLDLRLSPKKYAKKHNIRLSGKGISKKERKYNEKKLKREYSEFAISGLNKAVKIMAENPEHKKIHKVMDGVENIITNPAVMKKVAKIYRKNPESYPNMMFMPYIIMNTLVYYNGENISEEEKAVGENLDSEALIEFCEKILKKEIKSYKKAGLSKNISYQMATVIPTSKLFERNRTWYKRLIQQMYEIAATDDVDVDAILKAVIKVDKKKGISKKDFLEGFFTEFILQKSTNKNAKFNDRQKELHEGLIERALVYLDNQKAKTTRAILKEYIRRRKVAEQYKTDTKRVIKFTDHANSNSPYATIKKAVQDLIETNSANELYLS